MPRAASLCSSSQKSRLAVEQKKFRLVEHAGRQGEALLPAPGERARKLAGPALEPESLYGFLHGLAPAGQAENARREVEVLPYGEIRPEGEVLGHVADPALDLGALLHDVEAKAGPPARVRREQAAHEPDGRRLAAAVGAEEAVDLAPPHGKGDAVHDRSPAEALREPAHVDGGSAGVHVSAAF